MSNIYTHFSRLTRSMIQYRVYFVARISSQSIEVKMKILNEKKQSSEALNLFHQYKKEKSPTDRMIVQALKSYAQLKQLDQGRLIIDQFSNRLMNNPFIQSTLIHFYSHCNDIVSAERVFFSLKKPGIVVVAAMMKAYLLCQMPEKAVEFYSKIEHPNEICTNLLLTACARSNTVESLNYGRKVFLQQAKSIHNNVFVMKAALTMFLNGDDLSHADQIFSMMNRDVLDYGQMMKYFNSQEMPGKTLALYKSMQKENIQADLVTYLLIINACSQIGLQSQCRSIVREIPLSVTKNQRCQTALIDMWGKAGCIEEAEAIFKNISRPDAVTFTAMIHAYGLNGMGTAALHLFDRIPKEMIHDATYVCILNACSHSGLVDEARRIFSRIKKKDTKMYTSMVDCLSRSFLFDQAEYLIQESEKDHLPDLPMHMSLLSGARNARNSSLAARVNERMQELFPDFKNALVSASILFANTVASAGNLEEASLVRFKLHQSGLRKEPGLAWTEVHGTFAEFRAHDRSHPRTTEIYAELDRIQEELLKHGHQFDSAWIIRPLMFDETVESMLNEHSERLALAFNFIHQPVPSPIQVTNNLRICGDCHAAMKLISHFRQCTIVIRDANRVHHFHQGQCSCGDRF